MRMSYGLGHGDMELVRTYSNSLYFQAAGMILTILSFVEFLEEQSGSRTAKAVAGLKKLSPDTTIVKRNGVLMEVPLDALQKGEIFYLRPGMRVPADGMILRGRCAVDESAITGESLPVEKLPGNRVVCATTIMSGTVACQAEKIGEETTLAQIIRLVERAGREKMPVDQMADKIASVFVPLVVLIAILTFVVWMLLGASLEQAMGLATEVLVISCPCAVGLATPLSTMMGTNIGLRNGIFIKTAAAFQMARNIDTVVLDKTGTITEGKNKITDLIIFDKTYDREHIITLAASLEACEEYVYTEPLLSALDELGCKREEMTDFHSFYEKGSVGTRVINGEQVAFETAEFMEKLSIPLEKIHNECMQDLSQEGRNALFLAVEHKIIAVITISDVIKSTSYDAIQKMKRMKLKVVMLTGDNRLHAEAVGRRLGLKNLVAEVLPAEKEQKIKNLKKEGHTVAMIGDGINDAPALMSSDIVLGISVSCFIDSDCCGCVFPAVPSPSESDVWCACHDAEYVIGTFEHTSPGCVSGEIDCTSRIYVIE